MGGIRLDEVPPKARAAWTALRDRLTEILGDDLVAMWAHGGTVSVTDPAHDADLDTYVIVRDRLRTDAVTEIEAAHARLAEELGVSWDAWYVLLDDARRPDWPRHAVRHDARDTTWAMNRAHWLSGRYVTLHGPDPGAIVAPPTPAELRSELDRELEHLERHVEAGDTDPYEATYALLNGSRILHALETGNVAVSKHAAGGWAIEHLPTRWRPALEAAMRTYLGNGTDRDAERIAAEMAPFVAFVREQLPTERPADARPRWAKT